MITFLHDHLSIVENSITDDDVLAALSKTLIASRNSSDEMGGTLELPIRPMILADRENTVFRDPILVIIDRLACNQGAWVIDGRLWGARFDEPTGAPGAQLVHGSLSAGVGGWLDSVTALEAKARIETHNLERAARRLIDAGRR